MSLRLLQELNHLIIEGDIEQSDEDVLAQLGRNGFPSLSQLTALQASLSQAISYSRAERLASAKSAFNQHLVDSKKAFLSFRNLSMSDMLQDIVQAMQNSEKVPDGLLMAFREQSQNQEASEDDIREIWESFVRLGLIDTDEKRD